MRNRGFTLLELMIALGLSFIVFLALSKFTNLSLRTGQSLSERSDFFNLVSTLQGTLLNPKQCSANLRRMKLKDTTATVFPVTYTQAEFDEAKLHPDQNPFVLETIGIFSSPTDPVPTSALLRGAKFGKLSQVLIRVEPQEFIPNTGATPVQETVLALLRVFAYTESEMGSKLLKSDTPLTVNIVVENPGNGAGTNQVLSCGIAP